MKAALRNLACVALGVGLALVVVLSVRGQREDKAEPRGAAGTVAPHYSVVQTEGHNLIVTDNKMNRVYFYTIEADAKLGDELHMRGYFDLKDIGKRTIKPVAGKKKAVKKAPEE